MGQGVEGDRIGWGEIGGQAQVGQSTGRVVAHQMDLSQCSMRLGVGWLQGHCLLQGRLGACWVLGAQGGHPRATRALTWPGSKAIARPSSSRASLELHPVAADQAQVGEALHMVGLQLEAGAQERDRRSGIASW